MKTVINIFCTLSICSAAGFFISDFLYPLLVSFFAVCFLITYPLFIISLLIFILIK